MQWGPPVQTMTKARIATWNDLREIALEAYDDAIVCLSSIEIVERWNVPAVRLAILNSGAELAAQTLLDACLFRTHILIARAFPETRRGDRHLRVAIDFLDEPGRFDEVEAVEQSRQLRKAVSAFRALEKEPHLERLMHIRHKLLAHWAKADPERAKILYRELFSLARRTANIIDDLAAGSGTGLPPLSYELNERREAADAFWHVWKSVN